MSKERFNQEAISGNSAEGQKARLHPADLAVLSFYVEDTANLYLKIWQEDLDLPIGETCFRNVLFGSVDDINKIELPNPRNVPMRSQPDILVGAEAYAFLLRLVTGLESKREGDTHISNQFTSGWEKFKKTHHEKSLSMENFVQRLIADTRIITEHFAGNIRTQNIQTAAKVLAGHKGGQRAVIIGNATEDKVSPVTISLARGLSFPGKTSVSEIGVLHPNPSVRSMIIKEFEQLRRNEKLDPGLMLRDIAVEDMSSAFENYDKVYCDLPMNQDRDFDVKIIEAWGGRFRSDNVLVHLQGTERKSANSDLFRDAASNLVGFVSPEEVAKKNNEIGETNRLLRTRAEALVAEITETRMEGRNVLKKELREKGLIEVHIGTFPTP